MTVKGCGLFRRPARKSVYLVAATLDPPGIPRLPPSKGLLRQSCQVVNLGASGLRSEPDGEDGKVPPLYTPAIVLRAGISSDGGLLYASDALPLKLWITVPSVAQGQLKAVLKSVCLFLVDPTVVSDHGRRVVRPAGTFIREVQLDITMQAGSRNETFEVDPASWKCCRVPRSLPITKPTQKVVQPYLLQILCEFSCDGMASSTVRDSTMISSGQAVPTNTSFTVHECARPAGHCHCKRTTEVRGPWRPVQAWHSDGRFA